MVNIWAAGPAWQTVAPQNRQSTQPVDKSSSLGSKGTTQIMDEMRRDGAKAVEKQMETKKVSEATLQAVHESLQAQQAAVLNNASNIAAISAVNKYAPGEYTSGNYLRTSA